MHRIRTISFTFFTPFFFIKAGLYISLNAVLASFGLITALLLLKVVFKFAGVWPVTRFIKFNIKTSNYTSLLMSTGITFGTISALFGLNNGIITQSQYTILVTTVILSALIPTITAQKFFEPSLDEMYN
jgi:Kef-type K+ transport system membrane component KefB